ncbi:MAG TPA: hypothetical protein VNJ08_13980 [Bacteriovoracaceae bacterium]|nr:hypothetical protein [Bacteriovoracaceae bacterium]
MRIIFLLLILFPLTSQASFLFNYGLNYDSETEASDNEYTKTRTFHKVFLGASVNNRKTVFFGWNINSWTSTVTMGGGEEDNYSLMEMGPKIIWFIGESQNWYLSGEWNPYVTGTRTKLGTEGDIRGSGLGVGAGYRFRLSRLWGMGAGLHYHSMSMTDETIDNAKEDISDKVTNIMPMLEISILTK